MKAKTDYTKILKPDFDRPVEGYRYRNGRKFKCLSVRAAGRWPIVTQNVTNKQVYPHLKDGMCYFDGSTDPQDIVPCDETDDQNEVLPNDNPKNTIGERTS